MSEAERLLKRLGATPVPAKRHSVYVLGGERFTLHRGSKPTDRELVAVKCRLRKLGLLKGAKNSPNNNQECGNKNNE